jgi:nicotinamidase-related amidase
LNSEQLKDINEVVLCGVCADICDISFLLPLRGYFDQNNRNVRIIVPKNAVDTFNIPGHNRDEWNEMAFKFINQVGIETPHTYKKEMK